MNPICGGGFGGRGRGGGRGWRNQFYATGLTGWQRPARGQPASAMNRLYAASYAGPVAPPPINRDEEVASLKQQAESVANALNGIKKRMEELQAEQQEED